jgi:diguanylate cyclase (GGDEF)-like protein
MLVWLTALIPAFLLSYYRGLQGVTIALAGGMAVITATQVSIVAFDIAQPNWRLLAAIVVAYLGVSVGIAALSELLRRERAAAELLALIDRLTGLPNRRHVEDVMEREFAAAERGRGLAVVLFDLDNFKRVNDRHGHAAGDTTLREFAAVLEANTRRENLSGRFGGEEFIAVLRDVDADEALVFAQRVVDALRARPLPWGVQTVSAGVAHYQRGMGSYEVLVGEADRALYQAKHGGRDRVCVAVPLATAPSAPASALALPTPRGASPTRARIWIIDDDPSIRQLVKRMLVDQRHDMWDTGDAAEAIARFAATPVDQRPDVIVTDVIMPVMTGMRMIDQIALIEPRLRVIYMSGNVQSMITWQGPPATIVDFLEKPIGADVLVAAVQRMLARGPVVAELPT